MNSGVTIHVRFFASVREELNCSEETVTLPSEVRTVGQVRQWLMARGGIWAETLADHRLRMAYQLELCYTDREIAEGHEIAFFPPVTGG